MVIKSYNTVIFNRTEYYSYIVNTLKLVHSAYFRFYFVII